jgi:hypothetical protein
MVRVDLMASLPAARLPGASRNFVVGGHVESGVVCKCNHGIRQHQTT